MKCAAGTGGKHLYRNSDRHCNSGVEQGSRAAIPAAGPDVRGKIGFNDL